MRKNSLKSLMLTLMMMCVSVTMFGVEIVDAEVDYSKVTEIPHFSWGGSESAYSRLSLKDGCLHFHSEEATDPYWDCLFYPIGDVDAEVGETYTLHYKIKGTVVQAVSIYGFGLSLIDQFQITTDWVEGTVVFECTEANGNILMQCGDYVGDFDIAYLKITHNGYEWRPAQWKELLTNGDAEADWKDFGLADIKNTDTENNYKICLWTKEKGVNVDADGESTPHPAEIVTEADGNRSFICRATLADTESDAAAWDNQIYIESPRQWKKGEQYKLSFRYKASEPVVANTQVHKQSPPTYLYWQAIGDISFTTEWKTFEKVVSVPDDANGMWSVVINLNPNVKTPVDFYIDDLSWCEMANLDKGLFVTSANTVTGLVGYDYDNAVEFTYDDDEVAYVATVGTVGNKNLWVNQVMISTVRGYYRQFKVNTIIPKGAITVGTDSWVDFEDCSNAKIKLPAQGVWKIYVDLDNLQMTCVQVEGDKVIASGNCGGNLKWELTENNTLSIGGKGKMSNYNNNTNKAPWSDYAKDITEIIINNGVESIGDYAFYWCQNVGSVTIPSTVSVIGEGAFFECSGLKSLVIPETVTTISDQAFDECSSLSSLTIPAGVSFIGEKAFMGCSNLVTIIVDENNLNYSSPNNCNAIIRNSDNALITGSNNTIIPSNVTRISYGAFYFCKKLKSVTIPSTVTVIENFAFTSCTNLKEIKLPSELISIGYHAFDGCSAITSINIPASVTEIKDGAFDGCSELTTITVDEKNPAYNSFNNCNAIIRNSDKTLLRGCANTVIPGDITAIGCGAFSDCLSLREISIPSKVTRIDNLAFYGCLNLNSIEIPSSVKSIGALAFGFCSSLSSIRIPASVQSIGDNAFSQTPLSSITVGSDSPCSITSYTFFDFPQLETCTLYVPRKAVETYKATENWNEFVNIKAIPTTQNSTMANVIYAPDTEVKPNREIVIPIYVNNTEAMTAFMFDVYLPEGFSIPTEDSELKITRVDDRFLTVDGDGNVSSLHTINASTIGERHYRVVCSSNSNALVSGNDGQVLNIVVSVADMVSCGVYDLYIKNQSITHTNTLSETIDQTLCQMTVTDYFQGDANDDDVINSGDYLAVLKIILSDYKAEQKILKAADANENGRIDTGDLVAIVNHYLYGYFVPEEVSSPAKGLHNTSDRSDLRLEQLSINAGETKELVFCLDASAGNYTALQFDVKLPEGLSLAGEDAIYWDSNRTNASRHTLQSSFMSDGSLRVVGSSTVNNTFNGTSGKLLYIKVKADDNTVASTDLISLSNIMLTKTDTRTTQIPDSQTTVVYGTATGVSAAETGHNNCNPAYTIDGRRMSVNNMPKGVYIMNGKKNVK